MGLWSLCAGVVIIYHAQMGYRGRRQMVLYRKVDFAPVVHGDGQLAQVRERQAWRERVDRERRALANVLESRKTKNARGLTVLLTGWVTVQSEDCLSYKRRYFQLREDALLLFKDTEVSLLQPWSTYSSILMPPGRLTASGDDPAFEHTTHTGVAGWLRRVAVHPEFICPRD